MTKPSPTGRDAAATRLTRRTLLAGAAGMLAAPALVPGRRGPTRP